MAMMTIGRNVAAQRLSSREGHPVLNVPSLLAGSRAEMTPCAPSRLSRLADLWALAATETVSYGVLYYAFAAFLPAMQQHLAGSQTTLAGAFSLSVLVTGAGAIRAGVWLDRHGARGLMTAGSVLAAGSVLLWAHVHSILPLYLTFTGMGLAGAGDDAGMRLGLRGVERAPPG